MNKTQRKEFAKALANIRWKNASEETKSKHMSMMRAARAEKARKASNTKPSEPVRN